MLDDADLDDENARDDLSDENKNDDDENITSQPASSGTVQGQM